MSYVIKFWNFQKKNFKNRRKFAKSEKKQYLCTLNNNYQKS